MKHKRLLAALIVLALLCVCLPMAVSAQSDREFLGTATIERRANPLYEGLIDESEVLSGSITAPTLDAEQLYATTYVTMDKAAQQVRDAMGDREAKFEIHVKDKSYDYNEVFDRLIMTAFEHTGKPTEGDYLQWHYASIGASLTYGTEGDYYLYSYTIEMTYYTTAAQEKELDTAVKNLLKNLNVSSKSDYQKVCAVYDYICDNITYDYANLEDDSYTLKFSAYAALQNKTAVCQGYALLFYRLMLELDVDARLIAGDGGGPHAWNIVKLGNVYYNLDSTWDAGYDVYDYFLLNTENFVGHARYLDYMTTQFHTDYPMSATDYVDGVAGEPEYFFVIGQCGENAYFGINRDRELVVAGEGATYSMYEVDYLETVIWDFWTEGFDTVIVEDGITKLGNSGFEGMTNITSITLPNTLEEIGDSTFRGCTGIKSVVIPNSVMTLGDMAFYTCDGLKTLTLSSALTEIPSYAFAECSNLQNFVIPGNVQTIASSAFYNCVSLTELVIPASVTNLSGFGGCTGLQKITFNNAQIGYNAFSNCSGLKNLVIPENITEIGDNAFSGCTGLTEIVIPKSVTYLGDGAFEGCYNLKKATVNCDGPLSRYLFSMCNVMHTLELNGSITDIEHRALEYCTALTEITLPATVTSLDYLAFYECTGLKKITFTGPAPEFDKECFYTVTATANYPGALAGWTEDVLQDYGGDITWVTDHTHSYTSSVVAPTCTDQGYTLYTCACGNSYKDNYVAAKGHNHSATSVTAPTCTEQGYTTYTCECGDSYKDNYVAALGHEFGEFVFENSSKSHVAACSVCGATEAENCTFGESVVVKEATMDKPGVAEYTCSVCGGAYQSEFVFRISGAGRSETAIAAAEELKEVLGIEKFDTIILASGEGFADALAGSYLAVKKDAPILLVRKTTIELNKNYILDNLTEGGTVYILGGTAAVPQEMEDALEGLNVVRIKGEDRFDTNLKILEEAGIKNEEILICTGWNFADSLSASATGLPILMLNTTKDALTADQEAFLAKYADNKFTVIGGTAAVSEKLEADVEAIVGEADRVYGGTREETSVKIAQRYFSVPDYALVAYSRNFPDGLCGGPLAHALKAPLLLVNAGVEAPAAEYIKSQGIPGGAILGGPAAVSEDSARIVFGVK